MSTRSQVSPGFLLAFGGWRRTAALTALAPLLLCLAVSDVAAQKRCAGGAVDVTADTAEERQFACQAAVHAIELLSRCEIALRQPIKLAIRPEVRHPLNGPIFGSFDTRGEVALITDSGHISALLKGTPYAELPRQEFYRSLIVHEVVHGIMHQNMLRPASTHAAYEYPAYALQIASMPEAVRKLILQRYKPADLSSEILFNDVILFFDPYFFAARAYTHFAAAADGCELLRGLLRGEAQFIAPSMM